jgi:hypothetical protein
VSAAGPIVLFGFAVPEDATPTGPSIRLRQFRTALPQGADVRAALLPSSARHDTTAADVVLAPDAFCSPDAVAAALRVERAAAVAGAGSLMPAAAAVRFAQRLGAPVWVDLFGDPLAELHAELHRLPSVTGEAAVRRDHVWRLMREALVGGDAFSVVSGPQRHALAGQLALLGRIGGDAAALSRITTIPCGVPDEWTAPLADAPPWPASLAAQGLEPGARYLLIAGSWNPWLDEHLLGAIAARALEADDALHLVVAGIPTAPLSQDIRRGALEAPMRVASARVIEVPPPRGAEEDALLFHAAATILADRDVAESLLGSRNRLLAFVRWGARPATTTRAEVCRELVAAGLADAIDPAKPEAALTPLLAATRRTRAERDAAIAQGRAWLRGVTFRETTRPLAQWLAHPQHWPGPPQRGLVDRWAATDPASEPPGEPIWKRLLPKPRA